MSGTSPVEETAVAEIEASFASSFKGGDTACMIKLSSETYPEDELHKLILCGQENGSVYLATTANRLFAEAAAAEVPEYSGTSNKVDDITEIKRAGVTLEVACGICFDDPVVETAQLRSDLIALSQEVVTSIIVSADTKVLEGLSAANPTPEDYIRSLGSDDTPVEEKVPPGLEPEYWREFVHSGAAKSGICRCGEPNCPVDVLAGLVRYEASDLVGGFFIRAEAAEAIITNPVTQLLKQNPAIMETLDRLVDGGPMGGFVGPFGISSIQDLADVLAVAALRNGASAN
jgi:hypothetical protein